MFKDICFDGVSGRNPKSSGTVVQKVFRSQIFTQLWLVLLWVNLSSELNQALTPEMLYKGYIVVLKHTDRTGHILVQTGFNRTYSSSVWDPVQQVTTRICVLIWSGDRKERLKNRKKSILVILNDNFLMVISEVLNIYDWLGGTLCFFCFLLFFPGCLPCRRLKFSVPTFTFRTKCHTVFQSLVLQ